MEPSQSRRGRSVDVAWRCALDARSLLSDSTRWPRRQRIGLRLLWRLLLLRHRAAIALLALTLMTFGFTGCGGGDQATTIDDGKHQIVCTVGMVADVVREIAGEHATVEAIIGQGVDPHLYSPVRADAIMLQKADMIFYSGLLLEGRMGDVIDGQKDDKPVIAVAEALREREGYLVLDGADHHDPHVWMDVAGWMVAAEVITEALANLDPPNAEAYRANAAAYLNRMNALDDYARAALATIPEDQRVLVTAHDAFGYFGRAYDLQVEGVQGLSTEQEAGLRRINELVTFIVERGVPSVFVESSVPVKAVEAVIAGCADRGHRIIVGGELYSDAMGPPGTYEGTYIGMIDHNVTIITRALGGEAPERGLNGKLTIDE